MLGTPNAGSRLANNLCPTGQGTGRCRAALPDLRTSSMLRFNRDYAAPASVDHWVLGGDNAGSGSVVTPGRVNCRAEVRSVRNSVNSENNRALYGQGDAFSWYAYGVRSANRADNQVRLNSLFALTDHERNASLPEDHETGPARFYRHRAIGTYVDLDHGEVARDRCTLLPAFGRVLPAQLISTGTTAGDIADVTTTSIASVRRRSACRVWQPTLLRRCSWRPNPKLTTSSCEARNSTSTL